MFCFCFLVRSPITVILYKCMLCYGSDFNDFIWDMHAMICDLYAMLWEKLNMKDVMICMLWHALLFYEKYFF